jgi:hypothetical protein
LLRQPKATTTARRKVCILIGLRLAEKLQNLLKKKLMRDHNNSKEIRKQAAQIWEEKLKFWQEAAHAWEQAGEMERSR